MQSADGADEYEEGNPQMAHGFAKPRNDMPQN